MMDGWVGKVRSKKEKGRKRPDSDAPAGVSCGGTRERVKSEGEKEKRRGARNKATTVDSK
jgi:hypothetical protein